MPENPSGVVRFGGYEIDRARWQLRHGQDLVVLNRKTFDLLLYLVERADRVVTKDELLPALWPEAFIEESNLTQQVFLLRRALARYAPETKFIETVPGRGYRFAVPVHFDTRPELHAEEPRSVPGSGEGPQNASLSDTEKKVHVGAQQTPHAVFAPSAPDARPLPAPPKAMEAAISRAQVEAVRFSGGFWAVVAVAVAALVLLVSYLFLRPGGKGHITIAKYQQITHDGRAKAIGGTDGKRVYFTLLDRSSLAQVSTSGGTEALIPLPLEDPWAWQVSPDGSMLLITSQAAGQGPAVTLWTMELVGGSLHRMGNALSAAWSPDGTHVVCSTASGELVIMERDGTDPHKIATMGGNINWLAWSPDGQKIRFSRDGLLWQVAPNGSHLHQLLPAWGNMPTQRNGQWATDGRYYFVADGQIWLLDNSAGFRGPVETPEQLTYGPMAWDRPTPTPDGHTLVASGRTNHGELVRFDPLTRQPKRFLSGISAEFVSLSEAAHAVAYVSYPEGVLWRADPDGGNPVQLTQPPAYPKSVRWSPDGTQLAYVDRTPDKAAALFTIASHGNSRPRRLLPADDQAENDPSWSPDGQQLVFSTAPNVGASSRSDLRVVDLATGKVAVLNGSDNLLAPHWSPDGRSIAAMTLDASGMKLLDLPSGRWSSLDTGAVAFPEWSHDGRWIYYVRWTKDPALLRVHVPDGRQELLTRLTDARYTGVYTLWMGLDPEDNPMMLRDAGTDDIYALTLQSR